MNKKGEIKMEEKRKNKTNKKKIIMIVGILLIFIIAIVCISQLKIVKYNFANFLLKHKNYEWSLNLFKDLDNYKDSQEKKTQAQIGYGKEHTGTLLGFVSWKYNNFVGNRGDTGAKVIAINLDIHKPVDELINMNAEQGKNGIWISTVDGNGNYKIDKIPCGNYAIFIVSNNANGNYPSYEQFKSVISQKEWLSIETINNSGFLRSIQYYDNISINEDEETTLSYDFGFTKW